MRVSAVVQVHKDETHPAKLWGGQSCHTPFSSFSVWILNTVVLFDIFLSFFFLLLRNSLTFLFSNIYISLDYNGI